MFSKHIVITLIFFLTVDLSMCGLSCNDATQSDLVINTLNGKVKGECEDVTIYYANKSEKMVSIMNWLGIPFAEPPVGKLRFSKPQPVKSWSNIRSGTELPYQCVQEYEEPEDSEDCLYLSVYSPLEAYKKSVVQNDKSSLLPVFVWIHGGSWVNGSGADYDPSMISAYSNVVSVTINYRLGALAFLHLSDTTATGNVLLYDQQLAIKWVYDNADKFGGDRNRITICGLSAGSSSVGYQLLLKSTWPYYKNAILQSGVPVPDFSDQVTPKKADEVTKKVAFKVGCGNKQTNQDIIDCLQSVDPYKLNRASENVSDFPIIVFKKDVFMEQPIDLYKRGDFKKDGNIIIGYTSYEQLSLAWDEIDTDEMNKLQSGDYLLLKKILKQRIGITDEQVDRVLKFYLDPSDHNNKDVDYYYYYIVIVSDYDYKCPTLVFAEMASIHNNNMYVYLYAHKSSTSEYPSGYDGAAHAEEIEFTFGEPIFDKDSYSSNEKLFSEQMLKYWTNFVKYNAPSLNNEWPRFRQTNSSSDRNVFYLRMDENKNEIYKTSDPICKFWVDLGIFNNN